MARQGHIGRDDRRKKDGYSKKERGKTIKASSERSLSKTHGRGTGASAFNGDRKSRTGQSAGYGKRKEGENGKESAVKAPVYGYAAADWPVEVRVSVESDAQLQAVLDRKEVQLIYLDEAAFSDETLIDYIGTIKNSGKKAGLRLRRIETDEDKSLRSDRLLAAMAQKGERNLPDQILIRTFDEAMLVSETLNRTVKHISRVFDYTVYGYNKEAILMLRELGAEQLCMPIELNFRELQGLTEDAGMPYEVLVYGHLPMMVSANCIQRTSAQCDHQNRILKLRDRMGKEMKARCYCKYCYNQILNADPLVLYDLPGDVLALHPLAVRYDFTVESGEVVKKVLEGMVPSAMTRGHFRHGIE